MNVTNGDADSDADVSWKSKDRVTFEPWTFRRGDLPHMPIFREHSEITSDCIVPFPSGSRPLENQLGGHVSVPGKPSIGLLQHEKGYILKGLSQSDRRGLREAQFYETVYFASHTAEAREVLGSLKNFLPLCLGMLLHDYLGEHHCYLMLDDVTRGMRLPSSIDCKVGVRITDPQCPPSKLIMMEKKYVGTRKALGLSIIGVRYYDVRDNSWRIHGREYANSVKVPELNSLFEVFTNASLDKRVATCFLAKLESLQDWFERQRLFLFIAASLFLSYDADLVVRRASLSNWDPSKIVLKMIDFAHVFPANGEKDDNFLFGLSNLVAIFQRVLGWGTFQRPEVTQS